MAMRLKRLVHDNICLVTFEFVNNAAAMLVIYTQSIVDSDVHSPIQAAALQCTVYYFFIDYVTYTFTLLQRVSDHFILTVLSNS